MSGNDINRRDFLKFMGLGGVGAATLTGCDRPTTVTLEEGKEKVMPYLAPEEYVVPGIGVWYASTCQQCPSSCGIHGRVREGRVLKIEGNPDSSVNGGGLCQMGHGGLQVHYNPDRLTKPLVRKGGSLSEASWEEAWAVVEEKIKSAAAGTGWLTGTVSGHQAALIDELQAAVGSDKHYVYEIINNSVGEALNKAVLGEATPRYRFDKAQSILSFGADFLGTWLSPVHFAKEYAQFRNGDRGVLMVVEPKMTLTGANADFWVPAKPGTEGALALGIANVLITKHQADASMLPDSVRSLIAQYNVAKVTEVTGVGGDAVVKIVNHLKNHSPSVVLSGASAHDHGNGYFNAAAAMVLNILLGNVGKTIEAAGVMPDAAIASKTGNSAAVLKFAEDADKGALDLLFISGTNPVYSAPAYLGLADKLAKVKFKVALSMFMDETVALADVVLPLASPYEDWGTTVAAYQPTEKVIGLQQPLMQALYAETKGLGDILVALLKAKVGGEYNNYADYYAYMQNAFASMPATLKQGMSDADFWQNSLQKGFIKVADGGGSLALNAPDLETPAAEEDNNDYPMHLVPFARQGFWDGRFANIPWIQEAPDQITKVFWDSWAELHPKTAAKLGVKEGDFIRIESDQGSIETQVYIYKGVHPDVVSVPTGQGHENYGRYATNIGVNPMTILSPATEKVSGDIATHATRVRISKTGKSAAMPRLGGSENQAGRKLVATVSADVFRRTEGGANVA